MINLVPPKEKSSVSVQLQNDSLKDSLSNTSSRTKPRFKNSSQTVNSYEKKDTLDTHAAKSRFALKKKSTKL